MSVASLPASIPRSHPIAAASDTAVTHRRLHWVEKSLLAIGIFEVPLQLDKYFGMRDVDAELGAVAGLNLSVTTLSFLGLYAIWFCSRSFLRGRSRSAVTLGIPMLGYLGLIGVSFMAADDRFLSLCDWVNVLQAYLLFFYLANRIQDRRDLVFVIACLASAMLFQSLLVIGLAALGEEAAGQDFFFGPLVLSVWSDGRPAGSMHSAVLVGSVLSLLWLPVAGLSLASRSRITRIVTSLVLGIGLLGILLTQTRGAIFTTGLGCTVLGMSMLSRGWLSRQVIIAAVVLALVATVPLVNVVRKRILAGDDGSAGARKHLTAIAIETIRDRPLLGYGAGNCHLACMANASVSLYRAEWYYTIHCKYLLVWIETGIFGLLAFLCVLGNGIRQGIGVWLARDRFLAPIGLTLSLSILGHMTHMLVDIFNSRSQTQMLWIVLGVTAATFQIAKRSLPAKPAPIITREMMRGIRHAS